MGVNNMAGAARHGAAGGAAGQKAINKMDSSMKTGGVFEALSQSGRGQTQAK